MTDREAIPHGRIFITQFSVHAFRLPSIKKKILNPYVVLKQPHDVTRFD